jgi:lipopolysaccharide export system protein LptC
MTQSLRQAWERLSLYVPVLLMALLALGTYWLVRSSPPLTSPAVAQAAQHQADYFMRNFTVKTFDGIGRLKSEVMGRDARHYPDTDTLEIDQVQIRSFNEVGRLTTATATRALTNGDASEVQLLGNARVIRDEAKDKSGNTLPQLSFSSEFLHAYMDTERLKSHKPVALTRGRDHFTADSMDFDNLDRMLELKGRVKGILTPESAPP